MLTSERKKCFLAFCIVLVARVAVALPAQPLIVDQAGHAVGYASSVACPSLGDISVVSQTGYLACINYFGWVDSSLIPLNGAQIITGALYSGDSSCGSDYIGNIGEPISGGFVIETGRGLFAVPPTAQSQMAQTFSYFQFPQVPRLPNAFLSCVVSSQGFASANYAQAFPANAATIGFSVVPYVPPLQTQMLDPIVLQDVIYFNSFENGY